MLSKSILSVCAGAVLLSLAYPLRAGGVGPLVLTQVHGRVQIKPLYPSCILRLRTADGYGPPQRLADGWQPARPGELIGDFLLRTGPRSWAHLHGDWGCLDSDSLAHIDSGDEFAVTVKRGRVSAVDGRRGPALGKSWWLPAGGAVQAR